MSTGASLHARLRDLRATVAVAESLTGGLLTAALTEQAGASATVRGGVVCYATDLKASLVGVDAALLAERGAVDPDVALGLARGARDRLGATFGLGVTGVAGPEPQDGAAPGRVFTAVAGPQRERVEAHQFSGDRAQVRAAAVVACLQLLAAECARGL